MTWMRETRAGRLTVLAVALLACGLLFLLFRGEGAAPPAPVNLQDLPRVDGTLLVVEDDRLVMEPFEPLEGKDEITFELRDAYRQNFDLAHLRSHSSVAIPTRIFYRKDGDAYVAVYKQDAPANRGASAEQ
jgi:hypothetical protein